MSKKTSSFWLSERITLSTNDATTASIDLGAYVDVADRQAIAIEEVDFIIQGKDASSPLTAEFSSDATIFMQLTDLNRGSSIVFADDRALVASGVLALDDSANIFSKETDTFPDVMGPSAVRLVVNDQLYCTALASGTLISERQVNVTVRIKAHVKTLSAKDWMAIAIQSTAADN